MKFDSNTIYHFYFPARVYTREERERETRVHIVMI